MPRRLTLAALQRSQPVAPLLSRILGHQQRRSSTSRFRKGTRANLGRRVKRAPMALIQQCRDRRQRLMLAAPKRSQPVAPLLSRTLGTHQQQFSISRFRKETKGGPVQPDRSAHHRLLTRERPRLSPMKLTRLSPTRGVLGQRSSTSEFRGVPPRRSSRRTHHLHPLTGSQSRTATYG